MDDHEVGRNGSWEFSFTGFPVYDKNGNAIQYRIEQDEAKLYQTSYEDRGPDAALRYVAVNKLDLNREQLNGTIEWNDEDNALRNRPGSVTVQLYDSAGNPVDGVNPVTVTAAMNWQFTMDVPDYHKSMRIQLKKNGMKKVHP